MGKPEKSFNVSKKRVYNSDNNEYAFQLKRPWRFNWWWLLLLLPLLLFIQCHKDIVVTCVDKSNDAPISNLEVTLTYEAHHLWFEGKILSDSLINITQKTDSTGTTVFKDLPCSVYSYIFYCLSEATVETSSECFVDTIHSFNFHYTKHVKLNLEQRREDLHIKLLDKEFGYELPDGLIVYKYVENGQEKTDSAKADAAGIVTIHQMPFCSVMKSLTGKCDGYADSTWVNTPCRNIIVANDSNAMRLRPIKERFTFFVKDKKSKQPIADATCEVTLTPPKGAPIKKIVKTSTDGRGIGVYDDAFIKAVIAIHASKPLYKDGDLEGGPWTVGNFKLQDDDTRTIWLEPEPYREEFVNIDSITGKPIPGVKNVIKITDTGGNAQPPVTEISNSNGVFPVSATQGSRIEIDATKSGYLPKKHVIKSFSKAEKVKMMPEYVELEFRTIDDETKDPLPYCQLEVTGSTSGNIAPTPSTSKSDGSFSVKFRKDENISITASKPQYDTNDYTVRNASYNDLNNPKKRIIPLKSKPLAYENQDHPNYGKKCYPLHKKNRTFRLDWDLCEICTMITVVDDNGNVLGRFGIDSPGGDGNGKRYTPPSGSTTLRCPTETVCVIIQSVNDDLAHFKISSE